jgi:hypothetical protein
MRTPELPEGGIEGKLAVHTKALQPSRRLVARLFSQCVEPSGAQGSQVVATAPVVSVVVVVVAWLASTCARVSRSQDSIAIEAPEVQTAFLRLGRLRAQGAKLGLESVFLAAGRHPVWANRKSMSELGAPLVRAAARQPLTDYAGCRGV